MPPTFKTDHLAFVTGDTALTVDFYTRVMGWPLVDAFQGVKGDGTRSFISAFQADGFVLEFEEIKGRAAPAQQVLAFPHLGLDVGNHGEYERWKAHLAECGTPFVETREHNCWITDPNGVSFQLIVKEADDSSPEARATRAHELFEEWVS